MRPIHLRSTLVVETTAMMRGKIKIFRYIETSVNRAQGPQAKSSAFSLTEERMLGLVGRGNVLTSWKI